eukprot:GHVR01007452.1.p1 GENE.GHVR01007452.1~~GHVR01007452.1.p1  ORF type:complete len:147 (+),score=16.92 GHVR01007452.1:994-1434(+)
MKTCTDCKIEKEYSFFNKNKARKDGLSHVCRECGKRRSKNAYSKYTEKAKIRRLRNRQVKIEFLRNIKSNSSCVDCGNEDPRVLDFDHRELDGKEFNVGTMAFEGYSIDRIKKEMAKCDVRCSNCHRIRTHAQLGWFNYGDSGSEA